jgi:hypothetical protein
MWATCCGLLDEPTATPFASGRARSSTAVTARHKGRSGSRCGWHVARRRRDPRRSPLAHRSRTGRVVTESVTDVRVVDVGKPGRFHHGSYPIGLGLRHPAPAAVAGSGVIDAGLIPERVRAHIAGERDDAGQLVEWTVEVQTSTWSGRRSTRRTRSCPFTTSYTEVVTIGGAALGGDPISRAGQRLWDLTGRPIDEQDRPRTPQTVPCTRHDDHAATRHAPEGRYRPIRPAGPAPVQTFPHPADRNRGRRRRRSCE